MDDLDAGLHARPGPVVGDGAHDAAQPQRPFETQTSQAINRAIRRPGRRGAEEREGTGTEASKILVSDEARETKAARGGGLWSVPTARSLWSTTHSLADCSALFSSAISPESFLTDRAEPPNPAACACVCDPC